MFAPPRRFSQLATAFFALIRQGIRHKPFFRLTILLFQQSFLKSLVFFFETLIVSISIPELLFYDSYLSNNNIRLKIILWR